MQQQWKVWNILIGIFVVLIIGFNNCSETKTTGLNKLSSGEDDSLFTASGDLCEDSLMKLYQKGYYQFARTNCITCHASDADKPQFANPDVKWAYQVFMDKGYTKVSDHAISPTHQPPYSGVQHTQTINELRLEWQMGMTEYNTCKGQNVLVDQVDPATLLTLQVIQKPIPIMKFGEEQKVTWDLNTDVFVYKAGAEIPVLPGAKISALIGKHKTAGGTEYYTARSIMVFGSSVDIHVKRVYVKINGRLQSYPTTFRYVDIGIRAGSKEDMTGLISTGGMTIPGYVTDLDNISFAFEVLEPTVLPTPRPPSVANFSGPKVQIIDPNSGIQDITISVAGTVDAPVTFTIEEAGGGLCGSTGDVSFQANATTCLPEVYSAINAAGLGATHLDLKRARSVVGASYNRFDWDYQYRVSAMNLQGVNPSKVFQVRFSKDVRYETNRILVIKLISASSDVVIGNNGIKYFVIKKIANPVPQVGEVTFSSLMNSKGILNLNCVKCHNSRDMNGGYDMTDHERMLSLQPVPILIPGDPSSKMFKRMNANDPNYENLAPMPLDGFMIPEKVELVESWILNGAKNN